MKRILAIGSTFLLAALVFSACSKVKDNPYYTNGSSVTLTASSAAVAPTPADSLNKVLSFTWSDPKYATDSSKNKYILEIDSTGRNFAKKVQKTVIGTRSTSLTGREINDIVLNYGFTLGTPYDLDIRVVSSYGNNNEQYTSNTVKVKVTPYTDPSQLTSTSTSVVGTLATSTQNSLTFNWTPSFKGYTGVVTYSLQSDSATKNFANASTVAIGPSILTRPMTQAEINTTALNANIPGGNTGKVEYRIKATTAQGAIAYSNTVAVTVQTYVPLLRFYLPGSYQAATGNGSDWDPASAPELIRDLRPGQLNKLYYAYMFLPAGAEFKVTQGRSWTINYGGSGGNLSATGGNLSVATAGVYRISLDVVNMKYDIRAGRIGFVGDASGAGWNPPNVFPTYAMAAPANNLFLGIQNLTANGWKLIDDNQWNNGSNTVTETRSYGSTGPSGSAVETNGPNFPDITAAGRYRVIWDGRDVNNVKYEIYPATEMRVVGDGIQGVTAWDPPTSPNMTYAGNGIWTATLTLVGNKEFKFLAGNAWGAFDYEDNSGGSNATGTPRNIQWSGGGNFKTPATTGSYTITLNEYTQKVTIN
jgi:hypothetical protein